MEGASSTTDPFLRETDGPTRILHFLRHGHYARAQEVGDIGLTSRGKTQMEKAGQSLAQWPIQRIFCSDLPRAVESAEILGRELCLSPEAPAEVLREIPADLVGDVYVPVGGQAALQPRLESLLEQYFQPVSMSTHEIVVAHGNLIRLLFCHVLQSEPNAWLGMRIYHASITRFLVLEDGKICLAGFNEVGHLPGELISEI